MGAGVIGAVVIGALALGGAASGVGPAPAAPLRAYSDGYEHPSAVRLVSQITGARGVANTLDTWRIGGTDLGTMWDNGDPDHPAVLFAIGDTFGNWSGNGGGGGDWRSNALLRSDNADWRERGIELTSAASTPEGRAAEIIPSLKVSGTEMTTIPTGGIAVGGRQYLSFMSVNHWGGPGEWFTNYSRIAYSDDDGETWNSTDGPQWTNDAAWGDPFQMVAFTHGRGDDFVYMFGTRNGRFGPVHVARVPEASILDKDAYRYWDGTAWGEDESAAAELAPAPVTEMSVQYNDFLGRWMMMYTTDSAEEGIFDLVFRTADRPEGPWSPVTVVGTSADLPGLYAPFLHPWNEGPDVHFTLSLWGPYNVFQFAFTLDEDGTLIRPNLVEDPYFERSDVGAMSPAWQCSGPCGIDNDRPRLQSYTSDRQAWMRAAAGWMDVHQTVAVEPNTDYVFTAFVTTGRSTGTTEPAGAVGVRPIGPGGPIATTAFADVDGYQRRQVAFNSGDHETVEVFVGAQAAGDTWVQVDGLSLVATGTSEAVETVVAAPELMAAPTCGVEATVRVPEGVTGVRYDTTRQGTAVTVTAAPEPGYTVATAAATTWTFDVAATPCPGQGTGGGTNPSAGVAGPTTTRTPGAAAVGGLATTGANVLGIAALAAAALGAGAIGLWLRRRSAA